MNFSKCTPNGLSRLASASFVYTKFILISVPAEIVLRGPGAVEAYEKALKGGEVCDRRVPVMIIGQDGSGKTSLRKCLVGQTFDPNEKSTVTVEVQPVQITPTEWKARETEGNACDFGMARCACQNLEQQAKGETENVDETPDSKKSKESENSLQEKTKFEQESMFVSSKHAHQVKQESIPVGKLETRKPSETSQKTTSDDKSADLKRDAVTTEPPKHKVTQLNPALQEEYKNVIRASKDEGDGIELVLWDYAGQSLFYNTHPLFLSKIATYILTYNLERKPGDKAVPRSNEKEDEKESEVTSQTRDMTNIDYIYYWMSSVKQFCPEKENRNVFLVFTHADTQKVTVEEIKSHLKDKPYDIFYTTFVVDNKWSTDNPEFQKMRKQIAEKATTLVKSRAPIPGT